MARSSFITLTTDFGHSDHFVGVMKGVILTINPEAQVIDLNHEVGSYDIFEAAFTVGQAYRFFPPDTIHLVVVDPGVGTVRRPIVVRTMDYKFVAPDNGVLSLIYAREEQLEVRHITSDHYFLNPVSNTFHGRDIFAPVAGWLSRGVELSKFGDPVLDYVRLTAPAPKPVSEHLTKGVIIKVDKFGNLITNISPRDVPQLFSDPPRDFRIVINQREITRLNLSYSMGNPSELFAIVGSSGLLEICSNRASAAKILDASRGTEIGILFGGASAARS